ncbi:uncharacterized protein LACBIDRAFT_304117 [Laccaria bicolor S238N-H82]|uniref:Predicted protein n=1 Tax=Laccaria bicolor (strain S238N-H82 / ATCC MYA-4686) TaxID=486041 RepID=B0DKZ6_LACBS|nr:uncharacterized protein LACBIDRAFT_304117 [Laccaria bicolor S238N-H82]EDR04825.1 predicted protein [Laccaria bicolor S238N-H82]|eukprot:XP_001884649.1 predicted protein [Laccaria bicolor S238N-H82]
MYSSSMNTIAHFCRPKYRDRKFHIYNPHCPLRRGIICYCRNDTIFEHNIHSSGKHEPRIIVPKHPSRTFTKMSFVPVKGNRILLFAKYRELRIAESCLHLSIHEIRSDHRVGPALWSFNGSVRGRFDIRHLKLIKSTENELGITFWVRFDDHWKLFDISTTVETDASNNLPLIESGRIDFDLKLKWKLESFGSPVMLSPDTRILLDMDVERRHNETIDIHYLDPVGTNFSFVTRLSIPVAETEYSPQFAFSADGSKFVMAMARGGVFVWDTRSKVPLRTFTGNPLLIQPQQFLQFNSGNLGKEILVSVEHNRSDLAIIHVIDVTSFETKERLFLKTEKYFPVTLFFDPDGRTLYAEHRGTLYEWDLQKNKTGPEWWSGDE